MFTPETQEWMKMTIRLYDNQENGFGVSTEVWNQVKGRGWYKTVRGWLSLTEKGRKEIPLRLRDDLEKELHRLQRELNSHRLLTYIPGDQSEEEQNRQKERAVKLARFHEILNTLNGVNQ